MSYRRKILDPLIDNNPITVQILGVCSALAVSSSLRPALIMSVAVICVLAFSNVAVSLLRRYMPHSIRLILETTLIASAVIVVDEILKAFAPEVSRMLSVFVGLIITNCIILSRAESFAMHNTVGTSLIDGVGNGLGYSIILIIVAACRELLSKGTLLDRKLLPLINNDGWYQGSEFMLLAPSAFFIIGLIIWAIRSCRQEQIEADEFSESLTRRQEIN